MQIARRMKRICSSPAHTIDVKAKQLKASGIDIINFGSGEPDFNTPDYIKGFAIAAIRAGFTKYTASSGTDELREAVCEKLRKDNNLDYTMNEVMINCGTKHSIYSVLQVIVNPGDEVLIPAPYWVTYPESVKLAGGKPVILKTSEKTNYKITASMLRRRIKPKTRVLILNSPNNPTGAVYSETELKEIMEVAIAKKIIVISDEVYEHIIFKKGHHISPAKVHPKAKDWCVVINGVSKTFSMTGWRIGYCAGPKDVISEMIKLQSHSTSNPSSVSMKAAVAALTQPAALLPAMQKELRERRDYVVERLNCIHGIECLKPEGTFYVFPNVSGVLGKRYKGEVLTTTIQLADFLLEKARVAIVPGGGFGADDNIRISYATSMEHLHDGLDRIAGALSKGINVS